MSKSSRDLVIVGSGVVLRVENKGRDELRPQKSISVHRADLLTLFVVLLSLFLPTKPNSTKMLIYGNNTAMPNNTYHQRNLRLE